MNHFNYLTTKSESTDYRVAKADTSKFYISPDHYFHDNDSKIPSEATVFLDSPQKLQKISPYSTSDSKLHPRASKAQRNPASSRRKVIKKESITTHLNQNTNPKSTKGSLICTRKRWTKSEDHKILDLVSQYGESWSFIASHFDGLIGKQVRDRYLNFLRPGISKSSWTKEDDEHLLSLVAEHGHRWKAIAQEMVGRTENQVKNRYYGRLRNSVNNIVLSESETTESREFFDENMREKKKIQAVSEVEKRENDVDKFFDFDAKEKFPKFLDKMN